DWLIQQGIRIIDDYGVDWILQDGQNMVKECTKSTHTHDAADSNYANSVDGLNATVQAIQAGRPNVMWENCENGGNWAIMNRLPDLTVDQLGFLGQEIARYKAQRAEISRGKVFHHAAPSANS